MLPAADHRADLPAGEDVVDWQAGGSDGPREGRSDSSLPRSRCICCMGAAQGQAIDAPYYLLPAPGFLIPKSKYLLTFANHV
jgi:hypothetical protein